MQVLVLRREPMGAEGINKVNVAEVNLPGWEQEKIDHDGNSKPCDNLSAGRTHGALHPKIKASRM